VDEEQDWVVPVSAANGYPLWHPAEIYLLKDLNTLWGMDFSKFLNNGNRIIPISYGSRCLT
jgi:hypothetical protein